MKTLIVTIEVPDSIPYYEELKEEIISGIEYFGLKIVKAIFIEKED